MAKASMPYVVRVGDHIEGIAHRFGVGVDEILGEPRNGTLRDKRGDFSMLCSGDLLYVPEVEPVSFQLAVGTTNEFVSHIPSVDVHLTLIDGQDPIANSAYTVDGAGDPIQGTTDGTGHLSFAVAVTVRTVRSVLTDSGRSFDISVGGLDPIEETSGVQMRLAHLGFYTGPLDGELNDHTRAGITAFQVQQELEPTGEPDENTLSALKKAHGG
jgi:hypothetical protein